jgi:hypothetical protein
VYSTTSGAAHCGGLQYDANGVAKFLRTHPAGGEPVYLASIHGQCQKEKTQPAGGRLRRAAVISDDWILIRDDRILISDD